MPGSAPLQLAWLLRETAEATVYNSGRRHWWYGADDSSLAGWASACHGSGVPEAAMFPEGTRFGLDASRGRGDRDPHRYLNPGWRKVAGCLGDNPPTKAIGWRCRESKGKGNRTLCSTT